MMSPLRAGLMFMGFWLVWRRFCTTYHTSLASMYSGVLAAPSARIYVLPADPGPVRTQSYCFQVFFYERTVTSADEEVALQMQQSAGALLAVYPYHMSYVACFFFPSHLLSWPFFFSPSYCSRNSDPGQRSRLLSPLPTAVRAWPSLVDSRRTTPTRARRSRQ